jgi:hypothetical protein
LTPKPVPTAWRMSERTSLAVVLVDLKARIGSSFGEAPRTKDRSAQVVQCIRGPPHRLARTGRSAVVTHR